VFRRSTISSSKENRAEARREAVEEMHGRDFEKSQEIERKIDNACNVSIENLLPGGTSAAELSYRFLKKISQRPRKFTHASCVRS